MTPTVMIAILAKDAAGLLPFHLQCLEELDYPKDRISVYIRTNNNNDDTARVLARWMARHSDYERVQLDATDVPEKVQAYDLHEWNETRFRVLGAIRQKALATAFQWDCDYCLMSDVDNFLRPDTLSELVKLGLPIVAPFLMNADQNDVYSNYHESVDRDGYLVETPEYHTIFYGRIKGIIKVPVVHCTYLVQKGVIPVLGYLDKTARHEYVIFSSSARLAGVPQYLDNRRVYGWLTFGPNSQKAEARMKLRP